MKTFLRIFGLSFIWFGVWGVFLFYLGPQGINYTDNYLLTAIYFLLVIVALTSIFKKELDGYVDNFSIKDLGIMTLFSIVVILIYYFGNILAEKSPLYVYKPILISDFWLDTRFLITKAFEIMFQQTFFMISINHLFNNNVSRGIDICLFGLYSMFIHIPVLFTSSLGIIFFVASFLAGVVFSYFITNSRKGFIYSYMVHFSFYVVLAIYFWLGGGKYIIKLLN